MLARTNTLLLASTCSLLGAALVILLSHFAVQLLREHWRGERLDREYQATVDRETAQYGRDCRFPQSKEVRP